MQVRVTSRHVLPIQRIAHLNDDQHRQRACLGLGVSEYVTVDAWEHPWLRRALHVMSLTTGACRHSPVGSDAFSFNHLLSIDILTL